MAIHIKDIIKNCLFSREEWKLTIMEQWPTIVGALHDKMRLQRIQDSTVVIGVYDSRWMHELYYMQQLLLEKINQTLTSPRVTAIRFVLVKRTSYETQKTIFNIIDDTSPTKSQKKLSEKDLELLHRIKDHELRTALERIYARTK